MGWFDGIKYLWDTPEARFFLKLIMIFFGVMITFYFTIFFLKPSEDILLICFKIYDPFINVFFFFVIIKLIFFNSKFTKYNLFLFIGFNVLGYILIFFFWQVYVFLLTGFIVIIIITMWIVIFLISLISTKGTMELFEEKYSETEEDSFCTVFIFTWIIYIIGYVLYSDQNSILYFLSLENMLLISLYFIIFGFLGLIGIFAGIKKSWRVGFSVATISTFLVFLFVTLIPIIIGQTFSFLGPIISLCAIGFLFIRNILDKEGDRLRNEIHSSYRSLAFNLLILTLNIYTLIYIIGLSFTYAITGTSIDVILMIASLGIFSHLSSTSIIEAILVMLNFINGVQVLGIMMSILVFTIVIMIRQARK